MIINEKDKAVNICSWGILSSYSSKAKKCIIISSSELSTPSFPYEASKKLVKNESTSSITTFLRAI